MEFFFFKYSLLLICLRLHILIGFFIWWYQRGSIWQRLRACLELCDHLRTVLNSEMSHIWWWHRRAEDQKARIEKEGCERQPPPQRGWKMAEREWHCISNQLKFLLCWPGDLRQVSWSGTWENSYFSGLCGWFILLNEELLVKMIFRSALKEADNNTQYFVYKYNYISYINLK